MKRRFRLTGSTDFQRVRRSGKAVRHPLVVMVVFPNELQVFRIGVVAGRSVGNAVARNRAKRLLRHALQPYLSRISAGWDILLIARTPLAKATYQQTFEALGSLIRRASISQDKHEIEIK